MLGTTLPTPLYGLYRQQLGFSELIVTVVFAVYAVGVITALLVAGGFSDVLGRRPVLLAALALAALSAVCFLTEDGLPLLYTGRVLSGFSAGLLSGTGTAAVLELAPPGRRARAGLAATAANMGGLGLGPLVSGLLAQYAPWPLKLPFLVHLGLLAVAMAVVCLLAETVRQRSPRPPLRPQGMKVPPEARQVFTPSALAAFAGFSMLGLFTAVAPAFLSQTLGEHNLAVAGAVVFCVFCASTGGQLLMGRVGAHRALPLGCAVLVAGLLLIGASLLLTSFPVLLAGAVTGGTGQGMAFRAGLTEVSAAAPAAHRGATISAFFVIAYVGISLPVVGVGAMAVTLGLRDAGVVFTCCAVLLVTAVGVHVTRNLPPAADTA
ncbi:MFS transporter [Streptomyces pluripotens]|uniref:MFS transporter n=1 Tax=Streptomyces pluripotens TaxID=1355015 RepID=A0A221P7X6_9ACTN|nr:MULTISPECIES: MFS transporter [Streptomyces]ARP74039.1 MFS transporter [Streptomyces pluripotens]ASN28300.1 MFS transporter [Streptomyces pluripotens]KIE25371.1 multidrug transporter [Streptomyces sp. MUSC 125]MCH0559977.1 MFS transporter [Streptomyces sp. MUM 16J]